MDPIINFLIEDRVPNDEKEVKRVHRTTTRYWLSENRILNRRSFGGPYLLCLHPSKVNEPLTDLHEGTCGSHVRGHLLAY